LEKIEPIRVRQYGSVDHQPVLVLHGGPGAPGTVAGLARELAREFSVLEPLQRRSGSIPLTVDRHVEDLAEAAPLRSAVVGHSWGAMLGLSFAARYRDRISCLALVGCGTYDESSRQQFHRNLDERLSNGIRSRITTLEEQLQTEGDPRTRDIKFSELGAVYTHVEGYDVLPEPDRIDTPPADFAGNSETWQDALRLQQDRCEPQIFTNISCPVLMLHGSFDPHPGEMTRNVLRRFIPQLEYVEFERCGHEPWKERHARDAFLSTLKLWLRQSCGAGNRDRHGVQGH
jgi:pimeloyl-ACP methyl ester carboxylesterase